MEVDSIQTKLEIPLKREHNESSDEESKAIIDRDENSVEVEKDQEQR